MFIQINNDIIEILNDDILFIVRIDNNEENNFVCVYLIKRNLEKIFGKMTKHSLDIYSQFLIDGEKWNLLKSNMNL